MGWLMIGWQEGKAWLKGREVVSLAGELNCIGVFTTRRL